MRPLILSVLLLTSACAESAPYRIEPAPVLLPSPTPEAVALPTSVPVPSPEASPAAKPAKRRKGVTETPSPSATVSATATPTQEPQRLFYLVPFPDKRPVKDIYVAKAGYDSIRIQAAGLSQVAAAWSKKPYGDIALHWHRQLGQALAASGLQVAAAQDPAVSEDLAKADAVSAGARYLVSGVLKRFDIEKRGADPLFGTNYSGTNYKLAVEAEITVTDLFGGQTPIKRKWEFKRTFYDPTFLGKYDSLTFPGFFLRGLDESTADLASDVELRSLGGLAPYTPTNTPTLTLEVTALPNGQIPAATATPEPTPDWGPYWVNPKTGKQMDPSWKFDPADGTPAKDFVLRQREKKVRIDRPTAPK